MSLKWLAPEPQPDEGLACWLVRTAEAHLITAHELDAQLGFSIWDFERGSTKHLDQLESVVCKPAEQLRGMIPPDLQWRPRGRLRWPNENWAACRACLAEDAAKGRPPYIRTWWTHPLATWCPAHRQNLAPHFECETKVVPIETLYAPWEEPPFSIPALAGANFDDRTVLDRVVDANAKSMRGQPSEIRRLRCAVSDMVDALSTHGRHPDQGAVINYFQFLLFGRWKKIGGLTSIQWNQWQWMPVATRLLYVRTALFIMADPKDPLSLRDPNQPQVGLSGLQPKTFKARQRSMPLFEHAIPDPLIVLGMLLPRSAVVAMGRRSLRWPADLRRRWTYAAAVRALDGAKD